MEQEPIVTTEAIPNPPPCYREYLRVLSRSPGTLVELLISTVHRINARADKKVVAEFVKDFRRVTGKDHCSARSPRPPWRLPTTRCAR